MLHIFYFSLYIYYLDLLLTLHYNNSMARYSTSYFPFAHVFTRHNILEMCQSVRDLFLCGYIVNNALT